MRFSFLLRFGFYTIDFKIYRKIITFFSNQVSSFRSSVNFVKDLDFFNKFYQVALYEIYLNPQNQFSDIQPHISITTTYLYAYITVVL